jgi:hypothetical protein
MEVWDDDGMRGRDFHGAVPDIPLNELDAKSHMEQCVDLVGKKSGNQGSLTYRCVCVFMCNCVCICVCNYVCAAVIFLLWIQLYCMHSAMIVDLAKEGAFACNLSHLNDYQQALNIGLRISSRVSGSMANAQPNTHTNNPSSSSSDSKSNPSDVAHRHHSHESFTMDSNQNDKEARVHNNSFYRYTTHACDCVLNLFVRSSCMRRIRTCTHTHTHILTHTHTHTHTHTRNNFEGSLSVSRFKMVEYFVSIMSLMRDFFSVSHTEYTESLSKYPLTEIVGGE